VLIQGFRDRGDFLFAWRREVAQLHLGMEFRREIDAPGQLPEGVAYLRAELPDQGAEGFVHGVTYDIGTSPLSMQSVTDYIHQDILTGGIFSKQIMPAKTLALYCQI
jgi:hypothetical protein